VSGDGEHLGATAATCELCFGYGRRSLRLHFHAEIKKKITN
jgi:hypothetical protein